MSNECTKPDYYQKYEHIQHAKSANNKRYYNNLKQNEEKLAAFKNKQKQVYNNLKNDVFTLNPKP